MTWLATWPGACTAHDTEVAANAAAEQATRAGAAGVVVYEIADDRIEAL